MAPARNVSPTVTGRTEVALPGRITVEAPAVSSVLQLLVAFRSKVCSMTASLRIWGLDRPITPLLDRCTEPLGLELSAMLDGLQDHNPNRPDASPSCLS
jgi:hypothetical protein